MRCATLPQAARFFGVSIPTLHEWLTDTGIEPLQVRQGSVVTWRLSPAQIEELVRCYSSRPNASSPEPSTLERIHSLLLELSHHSDEYLAEVLDIIELHSRLAGVRAFPWTPTDIPAVSRSLPVPLSGEERDIVWDTVRLLKSAPKRTPHEDTIFVISQGPRSLFMGGQRLIETRRQAVRTALMHGWDVIVAMPWPTSSEEALMLVEDVLACLGAHGHLDLYVLRPGDHTDEWREFVLVPGHGALILSAPAQQRYVLPEPASRDADEGPRFRRLHREAQLIRHRSVPALVAGYMDAPVAPSVKFQNKITKAEEHAGERGLVMDGISELLVPVRVHEERAAPFRTSTTGEQRRAEGMMRDRQMREDVFRSAVTTQHIRDICTKGAIARLVTDGCPSPTDSLRSLGCGLLSKPQRRAVLQEIITRLETHENYELGLLEDTQAEALHIDRAFWLVKPGHRVLIETWHASPLGSRVQLNLEITDATIADAFYAYFLTRVWDRIDPWNKRKSDVVEWLRLQLLRLSTDSEVD